MKRLKIASESIKSSEPEKLAECAAILRKIENLKDEEIISNIKLSSDSGDDTDEKIEKLQRKFDQHVSKEGKKKKVLKSKSVRDKERSSSSSSSEEEKTVKKSVRIFH